MLASCFDQRTTNSRRCSMGDVSFQGTNPPRVRTVGVTHALGPFCYPCARLVPDRSPPLREQRPVSCPGRLYASSSGGGGGGTRIQSTIISRCSRLLSVS